MYKVKKLRRQEFKFGTRNFVTIWCDDIVLVEPEPNSEVRNPSRLIALLTLGVIHLLWKDMSAKGHELVEQLTNAALRSGYIVKESIVDETIVEEKSEQTD